MKQRVWHFASTAAVLLAGIYAAPAEQPPAAPVPPLIASAQAVFIANGGTEFITRGDPGNLVRSAFAEAGGAELGYDDFYAAMKSWGRYKLVAAPAEADLVVEFRVIAPYDGINYPYAQCAIEIFDEKTHFLLWSFSEPLNGANRKSSFEKNIQTSVDAALATLKGLSAAGTTP
jgi:hypothetical protein